MKMTKKILSVVLSVIMMLSIVPFSTAFAAKSDFTIVDGVVTAYTGNNEYEWDMPDGVTAIGSQAFLNMRKMKYLFIPDSVTSIAEDAFKGCRNLTILGGCAEQLRPLTENLGDFYYDHYDGFRDCPVCGHKNAFVIKKVLTGGVMHTILAEYNGTDTNKVYIDPDLGIDTIGEEAFAFHDELDNVLLPDGLKYIEQYAFSWCSKIGKLIIPETVVTIGKFAFNACENMDFIRIPEGVTVINKAVFSGCKKLRLLLLHDGITTISQEAFADCENLNIDLGILTSLNDIGSFAFYGCNGIKNVTLPVGISTIDGGAFMNCSNLETIKFSENTGWEKLPLTIESQTFKNCTKLKSFPFEVRRISSIGDEAFMNCTSLKNVTINKAVSSVSPTAFVGCSGLETITVDEANSKYDSRDNCNAIIKTGDPSFPNSPANVLIAASNNTVIPSTIEHIEAHAFEGHSGIKCVTIPAGVVSIGENAFSGCSGLESINVDSANTVYDSRNNCNAIIETATDTLIAGFKNTTIPSTVKVIAENAFSNNSEVTSIIIPDGVTEIRAGAVTNCENLAAVVIPTTVTTLAKGAFSSTNPKLKDVYFLGTAEEWNTLVGKKKIGLESDTVIHFGPISAEPLVDKATELFDAVKTAGGEKLLTGIELCKTVKDFTKYAANGWKASVVTADGSERIGTGSVITLTSVFGTVTYTAVVDGDLDGDGFSDVLDLAFAERAANGHAKASAAQICAASGTAGDEMTVADYAALVNKVAAK